MKKYFFIAAAALATLASCTEIENEQPETTGNAIAFKAVNYKSQTTKAAGPIAGTIYKTTDPIFGVFGFFLPEGQAWNTNKETAQTFMGTDSQSLPVSYLTDKSTWGTADTYYWPFTGSVSFAAYTPYYANAAATGSTGSTGDKIEASFDRNNGIIFANFSPAAIASEQVDLMYSDVVADQKDNTNTVNKNESSTVYTGVPLTFRHSLSQILFKVNTTTEELDIDINSIQLVLNGTANFVQNYTPQWSSLSNPVAYSPMVSGAAYMTVAAGTTPEHIDLKEAFKELTPLLVIPQEIPSTTVEGSKVYNTVAVNYSITQNGVVVTDTIQIPLASVNNTFEIGKKYVFELTFGPKVIYFAPAVSDWTENSGDDVSTTGTVTINYNKQ